MNEPRLNSQHLGHDRVGHYGVPQGLQGFSFVGNILFHKLVVDILRIILYIFCMPKISRGALKCSVLEIMTLR